MRVPAGAADGGRDGGGSEARDGRRLRSVCPHRRGADGHRDCRPAPLPDHRYRHRGRAQGEAGGAARGPHLDRAPRGAGGRQDHRHPRRSRPSLGRHHLRAGRHGRNRRRPAEGLRAARRGLQARRAALGRAVAGRRLAAGVPAVLHEEGAGRHAEQRPRRALHDDLASACLQPHHQHAHSGSSRRRHALPSASCLSGTMAASCGASTATGASTNATAASTSSANRYRSAAGSRWGSAGLSGRS